MNQDEFESLSEALARIVYQIEAAEVMIRADEAYATIDKAREKDTEIWRLKKRDAKTMLIALNRLGYQVVKKQ